MRLAAARVLATQGHHLLRLLVAKEVEDETAHQVGLLHRRYVRGTGHDSELSLGQLGREGCVVLDFHDLD